MMSRQYYFLVAGLPELVFNDNKQIISVAEYREIMSEYLSGADLDIIHSFFLKNDGINILSKLTKTGNRIQQKGILTDTEIEEIILLIKDGSFNKKLFPAIPASFFHFIESYLDDKPVFEGVSWEHQILRLYYEHAMNIKNTFISAWYAFERNLLNILSAAESKKHNIPAELQVIGQDEFIEGLVRSNARDMGIDNEFPLRDQIIRILEEDDIFEREKKIDLVRWEYLDENIFFYYFTIERLFSYLIKLSITDRWLSLDKTTGQEFLNKMITSMEASYKFPEEFTLKTK